MSIQDETSSDRWLSHCVWIVALWASFFNLLNFNGYPLFRPEVAITMLALALVGGVMALIQQAAKPRLWFLVVALFAAVLVDLNASISAIWFLGCWAIFAVIAFYVREVFVKILFAAAAAVLFFQGAELVLDDGSPREAGNEAQNLQALDRDRADRPAIVHLVLDSYLGLDGMALGPDIYRDLRTEQVRFFTSHDFQVYPRAYSPYAKTLNSLPALFSYGQDEPVVHSITSEYSIPEQLPYFADLDAMGYRIDALLPAYFDLCVKQKLTQCRTFESSGLSSMLGTEMSATDRAKVFGFTMLNLTRTIRSATGRIRPDPGARLAHNRSELFPLTSLRQFENFIAEVAGLREEEVKFAHILLPHDPYMLAADCTVKPESRWLDEHGPGTAAAREQGYADQVRCLQQRLDRLLDALDRTPAGREAIVLIHGDHGSRIAPTQPFVDGPQLSPRELLMSYSTFFAIRVPGESPGEVPGTHSLGRLMADFRAREFAAAPRPAPAVDQVAVTDAAGTPREWRPLPGFTR